MKKITYIFALLALAACSEDDVVQTTSSDEIRVSVATDLNTISSTSRGEHKGTTTAGGSGSAMAAIKLTVLKHSPSAGLTIERVIDDEDVIYAIYGTDKFESWGYAGGKRYYWPTSGTLDFYAYHFAPQAEFAKLYGDDNAASVMELNHFDSAGINYDATDGVTYILKGVKPLIAKNFAGTAGDAALKNASIEQAVSDKQTQLDSDQAVLEYYLGTIGSQDWDALNQTYNMRDDDGNVIVDGVCQFIKEKCTDNADFAGLTENADIVAVCRGYYKQSIETEAAQAYESQKLSKINSYQDDLLYSALTDKGKTSLVTLNFRHALSQIKLSMSIASPNLFIYVPQGGITLCGFKNIGDLTFGKISTTTNFGNKKANSDYGYSGDCSWTYDSSDTPADNWTYLDYQANTLMSKTVSIDQASFDPAMLIPQTWNTSYATANTWNGVVYLKVSCYIASIDNADDQTYIKEYAKTNDPTTAIFNGDSSRSACGVLLYGDPTSDTHLKDLYIPLPNGLWEAGKKYIYKLVFNTNNGTGPATDPDGNPIQKVGIDLNVTTDDWGTSTNSAINTDTTL